MSQLARQHGINRKTVTKWRERASVEDAPMGPKSPRSTVLSAAEEAAIVAFRRHTLLPLDDCLYALQATIPHLRRSSLHRCLQRHGISRLPELKGDVPTKKRFKQYCRSCTIWLGYIHIDIAEVATAEVATAEGKLHLFVAIDRTSKVAYAELHGEAKRATAVAFLRAVIAFFPYCLHTVLTDNGIQFTHCKQDRYAFRHLFDRVCQ